MDLIQMIRKLEFTKEMSIQNGNFKKYTEKYFNNKAEHIYNSSHIEGNTISLGDTEKIIKGIQVKDNYFSFREKIEIIDLDKAINKLIDYIKNNLEITEERIKDLHYLVYSEKQNYRGEYRDHGSTSSMYPDKAIYLHQNYIEEEMENLIERFYMEDNYSDIEKVVNFKLDFILIHPFSDGNGRMSRLLLNWALITKGFIPINIMADDRDNYIEVLDRCRIENTNRYFLEYIINILLEEYNKIINSELNWE